MNKIERYYNVSCISYMEEKQLKRFLMIYRNDIKHYAYAFHDKDDNEPHFHIILLWHNSASLSAIKKRFKRFTEQNTLIEPLIDRSACFEYLTHENEENKHHYEKCIVKADDINYWQKISYEEDCEENKAVSIIADLISGVPLNLMLKRYGAHLVINYEKYRSFAFAVEKEQSEKPHLIDEDGVVIK